jgi:predicted DNA binding protein
VYGTATTAAAVDALDAIVAALPYWDAVRYHGEGHPRSFEVQLSEAPVLSAVASLGGYVEAAVIEDGNYRMTLHLAPNTEVRKVIAAVNEAYPTAEMLRRRQINRSSADRQWNPRELVGDLTERQRAALEAAFYAGFFEWPRDTSGEDVAESIGVAPPTFHQHLRKAERKVFATLLAVATGQGDGERSA